VTSTQFTAIDAVHGAMFVVTGVMGILAAFQVMSKGLSFTLF
jgi:hypothetical protein